MVDAAASAAASAAWLAANHPEWNQNSGSAAQAAATNAAYLSNQLPVIPKYAAGGGASYTAAEIADAQSELAKHNTDFGVGINYSQFGGMTLSQIASRYGTTVADNVSGYYVNHPSAQYQATTAQYQAQQNRVVSVGTGGDASTYQAGIGWISTPTDKGTASAQIAREVGATGGAVDTRLGVKAIVEGAKPSEVYFATGNYITRPAFQSELLTTKEGQHFANQAWAGAPIRENITGTDLITGTYRGSLETGIHTAAGDWGGLYGTGATKAVESNIPTTISGSKTVAAFADYGLTVVNDKDQIRNALTTYVPYGSYTQEELQNTKLTIDKATGEVAIYQYNPELQQWGLIGGGGRNSLQSGMFSVGKSLTAFVTTQKGAGTYALPEGAGLSRLGSESTGGVVRPLSDVSNLSSNEAISRYFGAGTTSNLANYVDQVAGGKAEAPGANIHYTLAEGSLAPSIQYMNEKGVMPGTGINIGSPSSAAVTPMALGNTGAYVNSISKVGTYTPSVVTTPTYKEQSPIATTLGAFAEGRLPTFDELISPSSPVRMITGGYTPSTEQPKIVETGTSGLMKYIGIVPFAAPIEEVGIFGIPVIEGIALKPVAGITEREAGTVITGFGQEVPGAATKTYEGLRGIFGQEVPGAISSSSAKALGARTESGTIEGLATIAAVPVLIGGTALGYINYIKGGTTGTSTGGFGSNPGPSALDTYLATPEGSYRVTRGVGMMSGLTADIFSFVPGMDTGLEMREPSKIAPTVNVSTSAPVVTTVMSGGNQTISDIGKWIDTNRSNVDLYNKTQVEGFNSVVGTYKLMQQQNPLMSNTTTLSKTTTTTTTPGENIYKYGEWSKFVEGSGEYVSGLLNINPEDVKTAQKAAVAIPEQAGGGNIRMGLGALEYATTQPAEVVVPFVQGLMLAGALEVGGEYVAASAEGTGAMAGISKALTVPGTAGIPGAVARTVYNYGLPAGFLGLGAYQVTEGGTATKEQSELNIGRSFIPSVAFVAGGAGISAKVQEVKIAIEPLQNYFDLTRVASGGLFKEGRAGVDVTEMSTGGLFSTTPKGEIRSNLPAQGSATLMESANLFGRQAVGAAETAKFAAQNTIDTMAGKSWAMGDSGATAFGGVKAARPGETLTDFRDYTDFTSIASGGLIKGKAVTERVAAEPFGFDVGYTASDAFTKMFGNTEVTAARVEIPVAKQIEVTPIEITPKYDFAGIGGETRTLVRPEVRPEYSLPTTLFTQVRPSVKAAVSYADSLRTDIFAYTKPFAIAREDAISRSIARPDLLSLSLSTPAAEARSMSESAARSMTMFGSVAAPKAIEMSSILGLSSFMTSVTGQSKSTASEVSRVKTFADVINMPIDTIIGKTDVAAKAEPASSSDTKGGTIWTPQPGVTGLPWGDLRSFGGGGGGGGSGGGFNFTDILPVKSARDILFGKTPSKKKPVSRKLNKFI